MIPADDKVMKVAAGSAVDYNRFCMLECLPGDPSNKESLGETCVDLTSEQRELLATSGGNAKDPATVLKSSFESGAGSSSNSSNG